MIKLIFIVSIFIFSSNVFALEKNVPNSISIKGQFEFLSRDNSGQLSYESPDRNRGVTSCDLKIIAEDEYFNFYPGIFGLRNIEEYKSLPIFIIKSRYLDENGRYLNRAISQLTFKVANIKPEGDTWFQHSISTLINPDIVSGVEAYHHLTMGQPMHIELIKTGKPSSVIIDIEPMNAKTAKDARECLKIISGD